MLILTLTSSSGCFGPPEEPVDPPRIYLLAVESPDLTQPSTPVPGRITWLSTHDGRARLLSGGRELSSNQTIVDGGEVVTSAVQPNWLEPGINDVIIDLTVERSGTVVSSEPASLVVDAPCTWTRHCGDGRDCLAFECVDL